MPDAVTLIVLVLGAYRLTVRAYLYVRGMEGTCGCGCGAATAVATKTDRSKGWEKGRPLRFLRGHNASVTNRPRRELSATDYTVEDHGYETPCWIWRGKPTSSQGYCRVGINGKFEAAHRAYYERFVGLVPDGLELHHLCEQHACVRPDHLTPLPKGEHVGLHKRKLSDDQVRAIREDRRPLLQIAAAYGISRNYACSIRTGLVRA